MMARNISHKPGILRILPVILLFATFSTISCKEDEDKSNLKDILSFILEEQSDSAVIDNMNHSVSVIVKYYADLANLAPEIKVSTGATISPTSGVPVDFSSGQAIYTVTAEDKSTQTWTIHITKLEEMEKKLLTFTIGGLNGPAVITDSTVDLQMKSQIQLNSLTPKITISDSCTISPASGSPVDFSSGPVIYTITAADGSAKEIKVTVTRILYDKSRITSISVPDQLRSAAIYGSSCYLFVSASADLSLLDPSITLSNGAIIYSLPGEDNNFSDGVEKYIVKAENGDSTIWAVYVTYEQINADNSNIQYTGRISFTDPLKPKFSSSGVYVRAKFSGTFCDLVMKDESKYSYHNFIQAVVDDMAPVRLQIDEKTIHRIVSGLTDGEHTVTIYKDSEAGIGYLEFQGFRCKALLPLPAKPAKKMEFIGNSITCGSGTVNDLCEISTGSNWYLSTSAYNSFGSVIGRNLDAQVHITSVSGIGMKYSCCEMTVTMPDVYDRTFLENSSSEKWNFSSYIPDVVTISLGQNDGTTVDSATFCGTYVNFIDMLLDNYPSATIICMTSPMSDDYLYNYHQKCLTGIVDFMNNKGDLKVYKAFLSNKLNAGCASHPDKDQQLQIASELEVVIKEKMGW